MELMPRTRAMGGQGQRAGINLIDPIISRKAEKLEVASTLCQAKSQHSWLARTAATEAEAEKAGICTATHRGKVGSLHPEGRERAQPLLIRTQGGLVHSPAEGYTLQEVRVEDVTAEMGTH